MWNVFLKFNCIMFYYCIDLDCINCSMMVHLFTAEQMFEQSRGLLRVLDISSIFTVLHI